MGLTAGLIEQKCPCEHFQVKMLCMLHRVMLLMMTVSLSTSKIISKIKKGKSTVQKKAAKTDTKKVCSWIICVSNNNY